MTESEWLLSTDPAAMLRVLGEHAGPRKLRLFACACCRLLWHELIDDRSRAAVEAAERYADGLLEEDERETLFQEASRASREVLTPPGTSDTTLQLRRPRDPGRLFRAAISAAFAVGSGVDDLDNHLRAGAAHPLEAPTRARLVRCIFRGPFPPSKREKPPAHLVQWAHGIYDERAFDEMPFLADALDEAGCTDPALLEHMRGPGPHVRGCWAIDLLRSYNL